MIEPSHASILENVTSAAVWGSLAASFGLGIFFLVQASVDRSNRPRFLAFSAVNLLVAANDMLHPFMSFYDYERFRIVLWSLYPGVLLWVLRFPVLVALWTPILFFTASSAVWLFWKPELATSMVVGPSAYIAATAHALDFKRRHCYASCILCGASLALGMLSSFYYFFVASGDLSLIATGYAHHAGLSLLALTFGWVYFPREQSGRAPVRVSSRAAASYVGAMAAGQAIVLWSLLARTPWSISGYLSGCLVILAATLALFFLHRHQLVIYTENVTVLLNERTASLRQAQEQLARQNDRQAELLRRQAAEIYRKNEVIERQRRLELAAQTAGQAAHDIRNLLQPIRIQLALLERHLDEQKQAQIIHRQFNRLTDLTEQLLTLSRRGQFQLQPALLNELLRDACLETGGVPVRVEWEGDAWASVCPGQLLRAVTNLLTNALDATGRRPNSVTLSCGTIKLSQERACHMGFLKPGAYSFLRVADCGPGICPEYVDRIFEPYFSSKSGTATSGSGLGLSIVAAVVSDHGGVLDLETSPAGTTFTVYLPSCAAPSRALPPPVLPFKRHVLVIDDDAKVRALCESVLRKAGYQITSAGSLKEGLPRCIDFSPDLILLDLHLPDGLGTELVESLRERQAAPRILIFSSYLTSAECKRIASLGITRFAYKPLGPASLLTAVEEALADVDFKVTEAGKVGNF